MNKVTRIAFVAFVGAAMLEAVLVKANPKATAIAVSFALAFGLGGKDFAKKTLDRVEEKIDQIHKEDK